MSQDRQSYHQQKMLNAEGQVSSRRLQGSQPHKDKPQGAAQREVKISVEQLPLCCPLPEERVWDAHPRVYLEFDAQGQTECPYCGTHFQLEG